MTDRSDWPVHQPRAWDAPIPGKHWYRACDESPQLVDPSAGFCEACGEPACPRCGREGCDCATDPTRPERALPTVSDGGVAA